MIIEHLRSIGLALDCGNGRLFPIQADGAIAWDEGVEMADLDAEVWDRMDDGDRAIAEHMRRYLEGLER